MMKSLRAMFALLLLAVCAVGWADDQTYTADEPSYEEATWEFEWNTTKQKGGEGFYNFGSTTYDYEPPFHETINGLTWYALPEGTTKFAITATGGQTIGTGTSENATHVSFWTEEINGPVKDITVNARLNKAEYAGHIKVSVGGVTYLYNGEELAGMTNVATAYKFTAPAEGNAEGKVLIELFQTSEARGTLYLKALTINYLKSSEPVAAAPQDPVIARTATYNSDYLFADEDIVITTETEGATIYYTLDAPDADTPKDPRTADDRTEYTAPITVTKSVIISAVAFKDDLYSNVVRRSFTMWKNPELFFEGMADDATVKVGYVGIPVAVSNPHNVGPLNWTSDDETIATVDEDGTVHALKEGQTNINFYFEGNDEYLEMGGRLKLYVEAADPEPVYTEGTYTHTWDKGRNDGGEGFYNFGSDFVETNTLTATLNGVVWTATTEGSQKWAFTANNGQAFGVGTGDPCSHVELVTSGISGEITEVKVSAKKGTASAALSNAALQVSVGGEDYLSDGVVAVPLTADFVEYSFKPADQPKEGSIKIEINQSSETQVVLYFKSIVVNYRIEETDIAAPTATPEPGSYDEAQSVVLKSEDEGAVILYTTDGSDPKNSETATEYTVPVEIAETTTLKAIAKVGEKYGPVAELKYVIRKDAELSFEETEKTVDYSDGYYMGVYLNNPHNVSPISYASSDETVVKLDGYADLWPIGPGEATITATFAGNDEYKPATASYKVIVKALEPLEPPVVSPAGGTFEGSVDVTITPGSDWGTRALTVWYSTEAATAEDMEDAPTIWWPEDNDYEKTKSTTVKITKSCTLIVETRGYNSLSSQPVVAEFVITPATGISTVNKAGLDDQNVYNLQGQRIERPKVGSLYIVNGRKVVVK